MTAIERSAADPGPEVPRHVPALDGFRALAILGVVAVHLLGASGVLARYEGTGTDVLIWSLLGNTIDAFFIISGFVLFLSVVRRRGAFGDRGRFWVGRASRLLPAFWLVLAIVLVLTVVKPPSPGYAAPTILEIGAHAVTMQMPATFLFENFRIGFGIDGPLWLISIVVTFYAVLPFIAGWWYRHPLLGLTLAAALTIGWKQAVAWFPGLFEAFSYGTPQFVSAIAVDQFPGWAFSFGLGMTGAWAFARARERWTGEQLVRASTIAAPLILAAYALIAWQYGRYALTVPGNIGPEARGQALQSLAHSTMRAVVMGAVIIGPLWLQRPFANRVTRKLAELSYGVYLIHWVIAIYAASYLGMPRDGTLLAFAAWVGLVLPVSLVYAAVSRRWFEVPARRWIEGRFRRSPLPAATADAPARP